MTEQHILIVEDEIKLASLLADYLHAANFQTSQLHEGTEVVSWLKQNQASAVLLDLMLPGVDGIELCKQIRLFSNVPILMLTAKTEEIDRLLGLEIGADDYICKPYSLREVVARVKAILRRQNTKPVSTLNQLRLEPTTLQLTLGEKNCELTAIEFHLLAKLMTEPGRIFNREQLMDNMYDDNRIVSYRTIDSHIKKLRKKLIQLAPSSDFIHSVYGVGYKFIND